MGWFLRSDGKSKTKRGKGRGKTAKKSKAAGSDEPRRGVGVIGRLFGWTVFLALLGTGWAYGEQALVKHLRQTRASMPQVVLVDRPAWMPPELVDQVRGTVAMTVDPDPFDHLSLQDAKVSLEVNPWVRDVVSVRRRPGGVIEVLAAYRQPIALLERRDGFHAVDQFGVRLPWVYPPMHDKIEQLGVAVIRGVRSEPPHAGQTWAGKDVQDGLKLAMLVQNQAWGHQVRAVDVSNHDGRLDNRLPHLLLLTDRGAVRWGRAPGSGEPGQRWVDEADTVAKLRHIERVLQHYETIDANGQIVDVYTDNVLIRPQESVQTVGDRPLRYTSSR